jgi:hypothetical protein
MKPQEQCSDTDSSARRAEFHCVEHRLSQKAPTYIMPLPGKAMATSFNEEE